MEERAAAIGDALQRLVPDANVLTLPGDTMHGIEIDVRALRQHDRHDVNAPAPDLCLKYVSMLQRDPFRGPRQCRSAALRLANRAMNPPKTRAALAKGRSTTGITPSNNAPSAA